jgi:hypothetical protein
MKHSDFQKLGINRFAGRTGIHTTLEVDPVSRGDKNAAIFEEFFY